jgi:hypothetical protein
MLGVTVMRRFSSVPIVVASVFLFLAVACRMRDEGQQQPQGKASETATKGGHVRIVKAPPDDDVATLVRAEALRTKGEQRDLLVYVGATWCEPCQRFHHAAESGDLDSTFPSLTLLEFDSDRDAERLVSAGYTSRLIPLFAVPGPDGRASGKQIEGGIKGDGAVGYITPRLQGLLTRR